jgi:pimeloyl-ACP methyl ester carboxylesterase
MFILKALVYTVIFSAALTAFTGTLLFRYECANAVPGRISPPDGGVARCLLQFVRTVAEHLLCVLLLPFGSVARRICERERPYTPRENNSVLPPLVLIHGIFSNASCWLYAAHALKKRGFSIRVFTYSPFVSPEQIVAELATFLKRVKCSDDRLPLFVTHSMGGLIARLFLFDAPGCTCGLITLGTPHAGSKITSLLFGKQARSLRPCSDMLLRLADATGPDIPCVSLAVNSDEAVLPPSSLEPPDGWRLRICESVAGHYGMLFSPKTVSTLVEEAERIADAG